MSKLISSIEIDNLAKDFGIQSKVLRAVIMVECAGRGFDAKTGNIKIQFEPHHFKKRTGVTIQNKVDVQHKEWDAYEEAKKINWEAALLSTSWGMGQIMGFNYELAGYTSVASMVSEFGISEYYQVKAMLTFIKNHPSMLEALRFQDWAAFARRYNGPNYEQFNYHTRLAEAYKKLKP